MSEKETKLPDIDGVSIESSEIVVIKDNFLSKDKEELFNSHGHTMRFPGTASFEDDAISNKLFFGRETEAKKLLHQILAENLVVIFSKTGNGKTSLLQAAIFNKLREKGFFPLLIRLNKENFTPLSIIKSELLEINKNKNFELLPAELDAYDDLTELLKAVEIWSSEDRLFTPVLIFDQFEEIFSLRHNQEHRTKLFENLAAILRDKKEGKLNVKLVIAIREDYLGNLEKVSTNIPSVFTNRFRLEALSRENAQLAITGPANKVIEGVEFQSRAFYFSDNALKELMHFLALKKEDEVWKETEEIEPIQLQIICNELEEKVIGNQIGLVDKKITIRNSDLGGEEGLKNLLANYYDKQIEKLRKLLLSEKEIINIRSIVEEELIVGTKRVPVAYISIINKKGVKKEAIDLLIANKLLRIEERLNNALVEISHDALIEPILKSFQERKIDEEKNKIKEKNKRKLLIAYIVAAVLIFISLYFWDRSDRSKRIADLNLQSKFYTTSTFAIKSNPTLAFNIALNGYNIDTTNNIIRNQLNEFNNNKYSYIIKRIKVPDRVVYADITDNNGYCIASLSTLFKWRANGILDTSFTYDGLIIGAAKVKGETYFVIHVNNDNAHGNVNVDTAEVRNNKNELIAKFIVTPDADNASISPDGNYFVIGNSLYRMGRVEALFEFKYWGSTPVTNSIFSPDTKYIISAHRKGYVLIQDTTNKIVKAYAHSEQSSVVNAVGLTSNARSLVSAGSKALIRTWDYSEIERKQTGDSDDNRYLKEFSFGHNAQVNCIAISPDDQYILTGSDDNTAILWSWNGDRISILKGHSNKIIYVAFSSDGSRMITGDTEGFVMIWKMGKPQELEKSRQIIKFSPFEYQSFGLQDKRYSFGQLYDTSTFEKKVVAIADCINTIPEFNSYPEDKSYKNTIDSAIKEITYHYNDIIGSSEFKSVNSATKKYLFDNYATLIFNRQNLLLIEKKYDSSYLMTFVDYYNWKVKSLLTDTLDKEDVRFVSKINSFLVIYFADSLKNYKETVSLLETQVSLIKSFLIKHPRDIMLNERLSSGIGNLSFYQIFARDYQGAIRSAKEGLSIDMKKNDWILTNLALGYLLTKNFKEAEAIYSEYKDKTEYKDKNDTDPLKYFKDSFLSDFSVLETEGIINKKDPDVYNEVSFIKEKILGGKQQYLKQK